MSSTYRSPVLLAAAALMLVGHLMLARAAPGLTHAQATTVASVAPIFLWIALPTLIGLAVSPLLRSIGPTAAAMAVMVVVGLTLRGISASVPPILDDDFIRYLWDGGLVAHGFDPYGATPEQALGGQGVSPGVAALADAQRGLLERLYWRDMLSIYPPVAQAAFAIAHLVAPWDVLGLRLVFLVAELATLVLLIVALRRLGVSPLWASLYWCNPFVAMALINATHVDALIPPLVLGALLAADRGRTLLAAALLGLAAGVKLWPILLVPLVLRRDLDKPARLAVPFVAAGLLGLLAILPLALTALGPNSGFAAYAGGWSNNNAWYGWAIEAFGALTADRDMARAILRPVLAGAAVVVVLAMAWRPPSGLEDLLFRALVVCAAVFYLSPAQFPWYAVWFLPLAAVLRSMPLMLASGLLPAYYLFFPLWASGQGEIFMLGVAAIHSVPVFAWLVWRWWHARPATGIAKP